MRNRKYSSLFKKALNKLKGKELQNLLKKRDEVMNNSDLNHYKNLKYDLKQYKRVHVNDSYVILFFGDDGTVYFVDYEHHDKVYKKKYENLKFE
ncbi:addiction module toxin RelE [Candidatus Woesearchaeota archaeon]|nr:addiction module toxin RelE [Nanoarchaeota archaeon]MCB9370304.1 addiction module toxin RelE [Candidatus Woesearchaeota archaeon]USN44828.1 MAG: addiction module toxin RelE [Candidatus Woesearchaeota archaeon]